MEVEAEAEAAALATISKEFFHVRISGRAFKPIHYENRFTKLVSISKNLVFYAFLVVRIY